MKKSTGFIVVSFLLMFNQGYAQNLEFRSNVNDFSVNIACERNGSFSVHSRSNLIKINSDKLKNKGCRNKDNMRFDVETTQGSNIQETRERCPDLEFKESSNGTDVFNFKYKAFLDADCTR